MQFRHTVLIILLILASCSTEGPMEILFCPQENCVSAIAQVGGTCAFYKVDEPILLQALDNSSTIVESSTYKEFGIPRYGRGLHHHKFCFNDNIVVTGSYNPAISERKNFNNVIVMQSPLFTRALESEWNRIVYKKKGVGKVAWSNATHRRTLLLCRSIDCQPELIREIKNAQKSIEFMLFSFTDTEVLQAVIDQPVATRGLLEPTGNKKVISIMEKHNISFRLENTKAKLHHKVWIIDDIVVTGSYNPSKNARYNNDELILIIEDKNIAQEYREEFERLWKKYD